MSGMAHFFVVVSGSKIHERVAHFFIDIYNDSQTQPPQGFYQPKFDYHLKQHDSQTSNSDS